MFESMRRDSGWRIDGNMLWGYFFSSLSERNLQEAARELQELGYRLGDIRLRDDEDRYQLHVERVETHTAESLHARNQEFYALAEKYELGSYDGMDVGPVPKS